MKTEDIKEPLDGGKGGVILRALEGVLEGESSFGKVRKETPLQGLSMGGADRSEDLWRLPLLTLDLQQVKTFLSPYLPTC